MAKVKSVLVKAVTVINSPSLRPIEVKLLRTVVLPAVAAWLGYKGYKVS